jgi:O-antigen/teichoic acid export membrane protein
MEKNELNASLKTLAKSSIIVFFGLVLSKIFTYLYRIIIARSYGPEVYGFFSLSLMVVGWFTVFSLFGLGEGVIRYISFYRGKNQQKQIEKTFIFSITFVTLSSILFGTLLFLFSPFIANTFFHSPDLIPFLRIFSFIVPLHAISHILSGTLRAFENISAHSFLTNIFQPFIRVLFLVALLFIGFGSAYSVGLSSVFSYLLLLVSSIWICRRYFGRFFSNFSKKNFRVNRELLIYSYPLMFAAFFASLLGWIDIFLLGYLKNPGAVGLYDSALPIAMLLTLPSFLFMQLFLPIASKEYSRGKHSIIKEISKQTGKWIFIINVPILFFTIFFPKSLLNLLFGSGFVSSYPALILLSIGFFFFAQSEVAINLLGVAKKSKVRFLNIFVIFILDVILNLILIPKSSILFWDNSTGIVGAALATMISYIVYSAITFIQAYHYTKIIPLRRKNILVLISGVISGALLILAKSYIPITTFTLIFLGILFLLIYWTLIILTKSLDRNDLLIIRSVIKR